MKSGRRDELLTWIALMVLLAITCASSYIPMGRINVALNLGIAVVKAFLVALVFMHLHSERPLIRVVAAVGLIWLVILAALSMTDFVVRGW
jgi:cytochrome c oxidase subunit 4